MLVRFCAIGLCIWWRKTSASSSTRSNVSESKRLCSVFTRVFASHSRATLPSKFAICTVYLHISPAPCVESGLMQQCNKVRCASSLSASDLETSTVPYLSLPLSPLVWVLCSLFPVCCLVLLSSSCASYVSSAVDASKEKGSGQAAVASNSKVSPSEGRSL